MEDFGHRGLSRLLAATWLSSKAGPHVILQDVLMFFRLLQRPGNLLRSVTLRRGLQAFQRFLACTPLKLRPWLWELFQDPE